MVIKLANTKLNQLAELLAAAVGIKQRDSVEDTIAAAIEKLNSNKNTHSMATAIKDGVEDKIELKETISDMYVSNIVPPFWDRVQMKYMGVPDLKSWAELDKLNYQAIHDGDNEDVTEDVIDKTSIVDGDDVITWEDVEKFLNGLSVDEYMHTCYDDDEYQWEPDQQDRYLDCDECRMYGDLDDDQLQNKLDDLRARAKKSTSADQLVETLTIQQRIKKAMALRAKAKQIAIKRKIALQRHASPEKLTDRARKLAIRMIKGQFSGGVAYNDLSYAARERIEKLLANRKPLISTLTRRLLPIVRKIDQQRFTSKSVNTFNKL